MSKSQLKNSIESDRIFITYSNSANTQSLSPSRSRLSLSEACKAKIRRLLWIFEFQKNNKKVNKSDSKTMDEEDMPLRRERRRNTAVDYNDANVDEDDSNSAKRIKVEPEWSDHEVSFLGWIL